MGLNLREEFGEAVDLLFSMMKVVHDSQVIHFQEVNNSELIFRFAEPSPVIIKTNFATNSSSLFRNVPDRLRMCLNLFFLRHFLDVIDASYHAPYFRLYVLALENFKDGF